MTNFLKGEVDLVSAAPHTIHLFCVCLFAEVIYNKEEDIGTYTIRAIEDPRTLNKILYIRPPANIYSTNELVSLWEKKIGTTLERIYIPEEELLKNIQGWFRQNNNLSILPCFLLKYKD